LPSEQAFKFLGELRAVQFRQHVAAVDHLAMADRNIDHIAVDAGEDIAPLDWLQLSLGCDFKVRRDDCQGIEGSREERQHAGRLEERSAAKQGRSLSQHLPQRHQEQAAVLQGIGQRRRAVAGNELATAAEQVRGLGVPKLFDDQSTDEALSLRLEFLVLARRLDAARRNEQRQHGHQASV
jgi:hypothetical protein